jgi:integrase
MPKRAAGLTVKQVEQCTKPGLFADGNGLYLQVTPSMSKSWVFRYSMGTRRRDLGLGSINLVGLAEARRKALDLRRAVTLDGRDPIAERRAGRTIAARAMTFEACAEAYIAAHRAGWKSTEHARQWAASLVNDVYPVIGALPVGSIEVGAVLRVLEPIWQVKPGIAGRIRQRVEAVLDWATARGHRTGENPARWRGHLENLLARPSKIRTVEHHAALPYAEVAAFIGELRAQSSTAARALEFIVLTAARSGEVRGATWSEIDLKERVWCIPASRMKGGREHRVPLSGAAAAILDQMRPDGTFGDGLVFPGSIEGQPIGERTIARTVERMGRREVTVHGFRSCFRDWAAERTAFPNEVAEMALAHAVGSKVEAAYRRGDLFDKRRQLAEAWAKFCSMPAIVTTDKVVTLRR